MDILYGTSIGDRQLIIIKNNKNTDIDNASTGYLFYKKLDGTNVLLEIERKEKGWKVIDRQKVQGEYVTLEQVNKECVKKH